MRRSCRLYALTITFKKIWRLVARYSDSVELESHVRAIVWKIHIALG
jgi:hypothetical protein